MNFLSVFEERIGSVFGSASQAAAPFSFKKLAKKAASEMEKETYVVNGVDTAPALFTVLVAQDDDAAMRPLYLHLTEETSLFLEAHAQRRGYTFVGKPLVRFMVDPSLKHGKFSVFAENVDVRTLSRLRDEELRYAGAAPQPGPALDPLQAGLGPIGSPDAQDPDAGLTSMPVDMAMDVMEDAYAHERAAQMAAAGAVPMQPAAAGAVPMQPAVPGRQAPQPAQVPLPTPVPAPASMPAHVPAPAPVPHPSPRPVNVPLVNPRADYLQQVPHTSPEAQAAQQADDHRQRQLAAAPAPAPAAAPASVPSNVPPTQLRNVPLVNGRHPQAAAPAPTGASALLIDRQTGRTYTCSADACVIGRERSAGGIVLHDPNVSRRHAQLTRRGGYWTITDLNSTNGTLVNDVDVDECALRDGDLITLGLTNLEFREG